MRRHRRVCRTPRGREGCSRCSSRSERRNTTHEAHREDDQASRGRVTCRCSISSRLANSLISASPATKPPTWARSEEHTSELQSLAYLVCRLLLEKKKKTNKDRVE